MLFWIVLTMCNFHTTILGIFGRVPERETPYLGDQEQGARWATLWLAMSSCAETTLVALHVSVLQGCFWTSLSTPYVMFCAMFIDYSWLHFVKTRVLARCGTRCLDMLVRHHSVPCSAFLVIVFNCEIPEDSLKIWFTWRVDQEACGF